MEVALPEEASAPRHADAGQAFPAGNDFTRYDVVVVGAGLGGLAVAIFLARAGRRVSALNPSRFRANESASLWIGPRRRCYGR
ncbi:MAG: FAD-binding protein [Acidobacteria bacterium]|nr:FAD-binding protein [Acidobacteriota bacterium]